MHLEAIERTVLNNDWITVLLFVAFVVLVIVKSVHTHRFIDFSQLFVTNKYLLLKGKEPKIVDSFNILMFIVNIISVSLFIFVFYRVFVTSEIIRPKILFIRIATAYAAIVLLKFTVEKLMANILSLDQKMNFYFFHKISYRNFMAMILLPVDILFIYVWQPGLLSLYIVLGVILFLNFIIIGSIYKKNQRYILNHFFYFILYLCALEIGPYFILYKLITVQ